MRIFIKTHAPGVVFVTLIGIAYLLVTVGLAGAAVIPWDSTIPRDGGRQFSLAFYAFHLLPPLGPFSGFFYAWLGWHWRKKRRSPQRIIKGLPLFLLSVTVTAGLLFAAAVILATDNEGPRIDPNYNPTPPSFAIAPEIFSYSLLDRGPYVLMLVALGISSVCIGGYLLLSYALSHAPTRDPAERPLAGERRARNQNPPPPSAPNLGL